MPVIRKSLHLIVLSFLAALVAVPAGLWLWVSRSNIDIVWWYFLCVFTLLVYVSIWSYFAAYLPKKMKDEH